MLDCKSKGLGSSPAMVITFIISGMAKRIYWTVSTNESMWPSGAVSKVWKEKQEKAPIKGVGSNPTEAHVFPRN